MAFHRRFTHLFEKKSQLDVENIEKQEVLTMRNIIIALLVIICLVGCGIKEKETEDIATTSTVSDTIVTLM